MTKLYEVELNNMGMPNFSTAKEVPQRMKGRWIHTSNIIGYGRCSACGSLWNESLVENKFFRFCPRCGADMRGEEEE